MKILKNINNNYAIAIDSAGHQLIISGKGIGFGNVPREVNDLTIINRSYYDINKEYISLINDLPEDILDISNEIVDYARLIIRNPIGSNIVFTLADHINFCIQRYKKNLNIKLSIVYDIQQLFEKEMIVGEYGLKLIKKKLKINLPKEEASYIALHIINAEEKVAYDELDKDNRIIEEITAIIEKEYLLKIDRNSFNYSRFVSHMHYLLKRGKTKNLISSSNVSLYNKLKEDYQQTYNCVQIISMYLEKKLKLKLPDEERLYLMLYINRLCAREDCNQ